MRKTLLLSLMMFLLFGLSNADAEQPASREYAKANKLFSNAKYSEALPLYQQLLSSHTKNIPSGVLLTRIGDCHFRLEDYKSAINAYRAALQYQKSPERAATQYWIGFSTFLLGNDVEAAAEFLKIPELYPTSGMWVSTAYYWAGRVCERMGKKEQAVAYYRKAGGGGASTQERFALKKADSVKKGTRVQ
jgi:tetratricopeptide (TPR) repeat protein